MMANQALFHALALLLMTSVANGKIELQNETHENKEIIYSVVSGSTNLPCNITPPEGGNDAARLVLWYKDTDPQPVYSFDNR